MASAVALAQFPESGNAKKVQGVPLKPCASPSNGFVWAYVVANSRFECQAQSGSGGLSAIANNLILGNVSGGSAVPIGITAAQVATMLSGQFQAALGFTPASPATAVFSDSDAVCSHATGCPAGGVVVSAPNTDTGFAHNVAFAQNAPGANKVVRVTYGLVYSASSGGPNAAAPTWTLRACLTANFTGGASVACSSGGVSLWTYTDGSGGPSAAISTSFSFLVQGGGSGVLYVTPTTVDLGQYSTYVAPKHAGVPMTAGAWTLYMTVAYDSAKASNYILQVNGPIVEPLN